MAPFSVVGQRLPRVDAIVKATGRATYAGDIRLPGMLYGKVLRSPYPHARILGVDTSRAEQMAGVKAVIAGRDVPAHRAGYAIQDETVLAQDRVRCIGEAVAAVAAVDEDTAERAVAAIQVEYDEMPAVFDAEEAMGPEAPLVHEELASYQPSQILSRTWHPVPGTNICNRVERAKGDVERGFREADLVFEDTFRSHMVHHTYIEPHAAVAWVDPAGRVTVWCNSQRVFGTRSQLAAALGIPMSRLRVIGTGVGGGFGGKIAARLEPLCVLLSQRTGRPVRMELTRDEEFTATGGRVPAVVRVKTGVRRDGTILAREVHLIFDTGAYAEGLPPSNRALTDAAGPYDVPHLRIESCLVYTHKMRGTPFRGLGGPQATWAVESQMDMIAERLGMDPLELRLRNSVTEGSTAPTGERLHSVGLRECLRRAAEAIGWGQPQVTPSQEGRYRGRGIAILHKSPTTVLSASTALVKLNEDGTFVVLTGASEIGQGSDTVLCQIAAEELGVSLEEVSIVSADTEVTPFDHGTFSSRVTLYAGNAVRHAAADARQQLLLVASQMLEAGVSALDIAEGRVRLREHPEVGQPLATVAAATIAARGTPIMGRGYSHGAGTSPGAGPVPGWKYGAQAAEVEVDAETGQVTVLRLVAAHDFGRAINPTNVEGQIEGGVVMGLGCTLAEEVLLDQGRITNPTLMDYRLPTAVEAPPVQAIIVEEHLPDGPFGAKGGGEPSITAVAPAIANAIYDAVGVRLTELPLTPERLLRAMQARAGGSYPGYGG